MEKIDVYNKGERLYHSPSGIEIPGGQTTSLPAAEAESLMKSYPRDLISPDSLRSTPVDVKGLEKLINELRADIDDLKADLSAVTKEKEDLNTQALEATTVKEEMAKELEQSEAFKDILLDLLFQVHKTEFPKDGGLPKDLADKIAAVFTPNPPTGTQA